MAEFEAEPQCSVGSQDPVVSAGSRSVASVVSGTLLFGWVPFALGSVPTPQPPNTYCEFSPAADPDQTAGLVIGADALLPREVGHGYGVHVRFNGTIGAVGPFDAVQGTYPSAAVLDCRGQAVLSPGFVNAHEHPAYSYAYPDANLGPNYAHRDEWRFGPDGKRQLPAPTPYYHDLGGDESATAALAAMELRHLLGGATTIAGSGGVPGVIRNVGLHERMGDAALYDFEADVSTFPFSYRVLADLAEECAGGPRREFAPLDDDNLVFAAYVAHVGEGRVANCAARTEVKRYLERAARRDRRYSLVHGVATAPSDYDLMRELDVTLVWSPRSNLALYGETIDLEGAIERGVRIALATDWSPSGSFNLREEARCASAVASESGLGVPDAELWRMATDNAAYALGLERHIGAIEPGRRADLVLVRSTAANPYHAMLTATHENTLAAWVGGRITLLSPRLDAALGGADCVTLENVSPAVCGVLGDFGWSVTRFKDLVQGTVALTDVRGQAPCHFPRQQMIPRAGLANPRAGSGAP